MGWDARLSTYQTPRREGRDCSLSRERGRKTSKPQVWSLSHPPLPRFAQQGERAHTAYLGTKPGSPASVPDRRPCAREGRDFPGSSKLCEGREGPLLVLCLLLCIVVYHEGPVQLHLTGLRVLQMGAVPHREASTCCVTHLNYVLLSSLALSLSLCLVHVHHRPISPLSSKVARARRPTRQEEG